jgi:hypothetical protein
MGQGTPKRAASSTLRSSIASLLRFAPRKLGGVILTLGEGFRKEQESTMSEDRSVEEMANEVLMRQAKARADRTGEPIEEALEAVLNTKAGAQLRELRDVPHDEESVEEWQVGMARERAQERAEELGDHLEEPPEHSTRMTSRSP